MTNRFPGMLMRSALILLLCIIGIVLFIHLFASAYAQLPSSAHHIAIAATESVTQTPTPSYDIQNVNKISGNLAADMSKYGSNAAMVIYDVNKKTFYGYNMNEQFDMASSIKIPIMLDFLHQSEIENAQLSSGNNALLTDMIEESDNDSATQLLSDVGNGPGLSTYLYDFDISGIDPITQPWGYSQGTAFGMTQLLKDFQSGILLNATDQAYAMNLMENIDEDEQFGLGDEAPQGASVAMKDGWVNEPNGDWTMNSSGIVGMNNDTYIISVYINNQDDLPDADSTIDTICDQMYDALKAL